MKQSGTQYDTSQTRVISAGQDAIGIAIGTCETACPVRRPIIIQKARGSESKLKGTAPISTYPGLISLILSLSLLLLLLLSLLVVVAVGKRRLMESDEALDSSREVPAPVRDSAASPAGIIGGHQTRDFREHATSAPAELGWGNSIPNVSRNRARTQVLPQAWKLHAYGSGTFGAFGTSPPMALYYTMLCHATLSCCTTLSGIGRRAGAFAQRCGAPAPAGPERMR